MIRLGKGYMDELSVVAIVPNKQGDGYVVFTEKHVIRMDLTEADIEDFIDRLASVREAADEQ